MPFVFKRQSDSSISLIMRRHTNCSRVLRDSLERALLFAPKSTDSVDLTRGATDKYRPCMPLMVIN